MSGDNAMYWRYKKPVPPVDDNPNMNGEVKVSKLVDLPHPLKCSKCAHIATSRMELNEHWFTEH